jgi:hypothetical protein
MSGFPFRKYPPAAPLDKSLAGKKSVMLGVLRLLGYKSAR